MITRAKKYEESLELTPSSFEAEWLVRSPEAPQRETGLAKGEARQTYSPVPERARILEW